MRRSRSVARAYRDASLILDRTSHLLALLAPPPRFVRLGELGAREEVAPHDHPVTLGSPRTYTIDKTLTKVTAGAPLPTPHVAGGGWRWYAIPTIDIYTYAAKAAARPDAIDHLLMLAHLALYGQLPLSEAAGIVVDLARLDPRSSGTQGRPQGAVVALRAASSEWAEVAIVVVDLWQARRARGGAGIGDELGLMTRIQEIKRMCGLWLIRAAEADLAMATQRMQGRPTVLHGATDGEEPS